MSPLRREDDHVEWGPTWEDLVERKIREAQEQGLFDNLPGAGRPLSVERNPYARDWELAYGILRDNGYAPPWIEASREMEAALDRVGLAEARWPGQRRVNRPRERADYLALVDEANRLVDRFNLLTPFVWVQRPRLSRSTQEARFDAAWPEEPSDSPPGMPDGMA
jgi:hypothetical protein